MNFSDDPRRNKPKREPRFKKSPRPKIKLERVSKLPTLPPGQKWFRCTTSSWSLPLGPSKPEPIGMDIAGFKFADSDAACWELAPKDLEVTNGAMLLRKFRREWRWWRTPMVWARNPEKERMPVFGGFDVIFIGYSKGFFITIERYPGESFGPHAARLYYRSWQVETEIAWVGICQLSAFWHSDERLLKELNHEIRNRHFFQSFETANTIVLQ